MDELSRIKAAFEAKGMSVNMSIFERALLLPDDRCSDRSLELLGTLVRPMERWY